MTNAGYPKNPIIRCLVAVDIFESYLCLPYAPQPEQCNAAMVTTRAGVLELVEELFEECISASKILVFFIWHHKTTVRQTYNDKFQNNSVTYSQIEMDVTIFQHTVPSDFRQKGIPNSLVSPLSIL